MLRVYFLLAATMLHSIYESVSRETGQAPSWAKVFFNLIYYILKMALGMFLD